MADLKYIGQGSFTMHLQDGRVIPFKNGTVVTNLPESVASELLERTEKDKPTWEPVSGGPAKPPKTPPSQN